MVNEIEEYKAKIEELETKLAEVKEGSKKEKELSIRLEKAEKALERLEQLNKVTSKAGGEEDDVCPECGSDLYEIDEEGVYLCNECNEYYEEE